MARPAFVLVETQLPENLGAAARVLANFGLDDLRLVAPAADPADPKAHAVAASGLRVLEGARIFATLADALADRQRAWATTALGRELAKPVLHPRALAASLHGAVAGGEAVAVVFGPERTGLRYEHLELADGLVHFPTDPACRALNLAQAVGLVAWEWTAWDAPAAPPPGPTPAPRADQDALFAHLDAALTGAFTEPALRVRTLRNLRTALLRAGLTSQEVRTLRGVLTALTRRAP